MTLQMRRAAASIALNTAEGAGNEGGNRRLRFRTARGSAKETRSCLDVAAALGYVDVDGAMIDRLDRIEATLYRLGH
jgi:four helix bundle protein